MKLGVVIPWFGRDLHGGAEQHAWQIATRLAARGHAIEVLTTCCKSHQTDWATNHYPAGASTEPEGFVVRRFPVEPRDRAAFDRVCQRLLGIDSSALLPGVSPVPADESKIFISELIKSPELLRFITRHQANYDRFILLPYLYGPILDAVRILGRRGALMPCLHDESYAYLPQIAEAIYQADLLLFISEGEQALAYRLFGPFIARKSKFVGAGVESALATQANVSCNGNGRYVLYLGRKDPGKNVPLLLNAFRRFRAVRPNSSLRLVLAGPGQSLAPPPHTTDAGMVSNEVKEELLSSCLALVQPSPNESFSRVMMEAWFHAKPVAVNAKCEATAIPVATSRGGWLADSEEDWARLFVELDRTPEANLRELGENGRRYAMSAADWESVMDRYESALAPANTAKPTAICPKNIELTTINQFLPNLTYGDAISNEAIWIRDTLRDAGFKSEIYVQFIDPRVEHECRLFTPAALTRSDSAIYHHSIGAAMTPHLIDFDRPKYLIYHNITPGEFFESYRPHFAQILYQGRQDLLRLAAHFEHSVGDSAFNAAELAQCGFSAPGILPLAVDPGKWEFLPDPPIMEQMQDGRTNILFVGRFAPNKKQDDLIFAFSHYLRHDPDARLILVGKPEQTDPYVTHLGDLITRLHLERSVVAPGSITNAELAAYYRTAHLFWSMSEHEGFCVPLIESMWFDVPVLAFKASAVPETLGNAGLMFTNKDNWPELAAVARLVVTDHNLKEKILRSQRARRLEFLPAKIQPLLMEMVGKLCPHR
jgi:glycosyltransferase involved in cell wall biosynthesis